MLSCLFSHSPNVYPRAAEIPTGTAMDAPDMTTLLNDAVLIDIGPFAVAHIPAVAVAFAAPAGTVALKRDPAPPIPIPAGQFMTCTGRAPEMEAPTAPATVPARPLFAAPQAESAPPAIFLAFERPTTTASVPPGPRCLAIFARRLRKPDPSFDIRLNPETMSSVKVCPFVYPDSASVPVPTSARTPPDPVSAPAAE